MPIISMLQRFIVMVLLLAMPAQAWAQANPKITSLVNGIDNGQEGPELVVTRLDVDIKQHGALVEVTLTADILNPSDDSVEGRFTMQLPGDAVLTGYALDIEGQMVPGSLIDQPKARQIYEDEVRGNIDPGLAEISTGNVFSTRIFPILPEGKRTISLSFSAPVDMAKGFVLPFETAGEVWKTNVSASFTGLEQAPTLMLGEGRSVPLARKGRAWTADNVSFSQVKLDGNLEIGAVSARSKVIASRHSEGDSYFAIDDTAVAQDLTADDVERVRIYWDRSKSRSQAKLDEERALIGEVLTDLTAQNVDVVRFASDTPEAASFTDIAKLDAYLAATRYLGATSFAGLDERDMTEADLCILFTDGGVTIDQKASFAPDCPLMIVNSSSEADASTLNRLADQSGGTVLTLSDDNKAALAQRMKQLPVAVTSVRDLNGRRIKFRNIPTSPGRVKVVGEMPRWSEITVRLSGVSRRNRKRVYFVSEGQPERHDAAGALWATQEVARLSLDPSDRDAMRKMAQKFQVASPTMAFLVLERPEQYIRAELTPPDRFSEEWMKDYAEAKADYDEERDERRADHFDHVLRQWGIAKKWWAEEFYPKAARAKLAAADERERDGAAEGAAEAISERSAPPPPPPPPPASSPPPPSSGLAQETVEEAADFAGSSEIAVAGVVDDQANSIIVTGSRRRESLPDVPTPLTVVSGSDEEGNTVAIALEDVLSDQPYLTALNEAPRAGRLTVLKAQELTYGNVPAFYLDLSEWFRLRGEKALARELLLSALELTASDDETKLIVAFRLQRDGEHDAAIALYEALAFTTTYRPQPKRALALALVSRAQTVTGSQRRADLERAFALLSEVVLDPLDDRYNGIETIALMELNNLIPLIEQAGGAWELDARLVAKLDSELRVVIEWTNADADLDLWVTEPTGERASYSNKRTLIGGKMSDDMTSGYGPEEYSLRRTMEGEYVVKVQGFSGDRINPNGPGRVMVRLLRKFGSADQTEQLIDAEISFDRGNRRNNDLTVATVSVE